MIRVTVELGREDGLKEIGRIVITRNGRAGHRENHIAHLLEDRVKDAKVLATARILDFDLYGDRKSVV